MPQAVATWRRRQSWARAGAELAERRKSIGGELAQAGCGKLSRVGGGGTAEREHAESWLGGGRPAAVSWRRRDAASCRALAAAARLSATGEELPGGRRA